MPKSKVMDISVRIKDLLAKIKHLREKYETKRSEKDQARFFASIRPLTKNLERLADISFIEGIGESILAKKTEYAELDEAFHDRDYTTQIVPFIKKVLSGSIMHSLIPIIDDEYHGDEETAKSNSALAQILFDVVSDLFDVQSFKEVSRATREDHLTCLKQYLTVITNCTPERIVWHENKTNKELFNGIDAQIEQLQRKPVSAAVL